MFKKQLSAQEQKITQATKPDFRTAGRSTEEVETLGLLTLQGQFGNSAMQRLLMEAKQKSLNTIGHSVPMIQLQRHRRRRWRPHQVNATLIDRLLAPNSPLWRQLNPDANAIVNCPATAAAVDEFLSTGTVRPALSGDDFGSFQFDTRPWSAPIRRFSEVRSVVAAPNTFIVVRGTRNVAYVQAHHVTPDHYFVIVNRNGIRGIDAYGQGRVISNLNEFIHEQGFESFRYYQGSFRVTYDPFGSLFSDTP